MSAQCILCDFGVVIPRGLAQVAAEYVRSLVHVYKPRIGADIRCALYRERRSTRGEQMLVLPRSAMRDARLRDCAELRVVFPPPRECAELDIGTRFLYEDQQRVLDHLEGILRADPHGVVSAHGADRAEPLQRADPHSAGASRVDWGSACLVMGTGSGKSFVAAALIARLHVRALFVTATRELAAQAARDINIVWDGARPAATAAQPRAIAVVASGAAEYAAARASTTPVVIVVANTLLGDDHGGGRRPLSEHFSLVIFDEAHTLCSNGARSELFWRAQTRWMVGMTATPADRRDGMDFALAHHLAPIVNVMGGDVPGVAPRSAMADWRVVVHEVRYSATAAHARNLRHASTKMIFSHYMAQQFAADDARNALIIAWVRTLLADGHCVFVFTVERDHASALRDRIARDCAVAVTLFMGGADAEARAAAQSGARVIVATYAFCGTGISIPRMTAMVLASPRYAGMRQIVGRITRRGGPPPSQLREVVDIVDWGTALRHQWQLRKNAYDAHHARYVRSDASATDAATARDAAIARSRDSARGLDIPIRDVGDGAANSSPPPTEIVDV